ncbi:MAG: serine/threonine protein kinase [Myxococcaceae bacterium]|nr:serine/threonine protein kinase [Myxococcaceae bacterium]MCA3012417.1 serine/threonine protein kinase [Myxococcaceae bacterium]
MSQGTTRDKVSGDALFILKSLKENVRLGRSNKLADVKTALENSVSLEFDSYFFFLRKFHYIAMDREAQLKLTDQGDRVVGGDYLDKFTGEVGEFFADQLSADGESETPDSTMMMPPSPPVASDLNLEEPRAMPPPPPRGGSRKQHADDFASPSHHATAPEPQPPRSFAPAPLPLTAAVAAPQALQLNQPVSSGGGKGQDLDLRYQKFDPIGSGPLGTVYKGKHNALGLDVCVKELKDIFGYFSFLQRGEVIKRLKKELCAQAQVRHPGVVQVLDQNTDVARPYFVMELCKGSLRERLDASGGKGIPVAQAIRYFLQLAYGLRASHQQGLTHHNIKPENVLFDAFGNAKLADFGLSRVIEVDQTKGMPQVFVGTGGMGYMSPELISRAKEVGASSDVYGLGILLYEMLTGQLPGRRSPLPSEVNADCPQKLDAIFDKMTQDRKDARYPDFEATLDAFYGAFSGKEYLIKGDLVLSSEVQAS